MVGFGCDAYFPLNSKKVQLLSLYLSNYYRARVGSPGFMKEEFFKYLVAESVRRGDRPFIENKGKFVLCHSSSGHKHAIEEFFLDPSIMARMAETKVKSRPSAPRPWSARPNATVVFSR